MLRTFAMLTAFGLMFQAVQVEAGVRGGRFEGTVSVPSEDETLPVIVDFAEDGNLLVENLDGGLDTATYEELDLLIVSFWSAEFESTGYTGSGISLFGFVTLYNVDQIEGDYDYSGVLFRTGPAVIE